MRKSSPAIITFVEPMYALGVRSLPEGPDWFYEIKFDGYRCIAGRDSSGVNLWSRRGNPLAFQLPTIANACKKLPRDTLFCFSTVAVLYGNGNGTFQDPQYFTAGIDLRSLSIADVNGDGKPDIVTADEFFDEVSVLLRR